MCTALGFVHLRRGAAVQAVPFLERSIKMCRTYAFDNWVPWTASSLGLAYALAGRHSEGIELAQEAVKRGEELRLTRFQPLRVSLLANSYLLAGQSENALVAARNALELARRYQERGPEAWALYLIAASMAQLQPAEGQEMRDSYLAALRLAEELGMRPLVAHCHIGLGRLHAACGDKNTARNELQTALSMYCQMDMGFWLAKATAELEEMG